MRRRTFLAQSATLSVAGCVGGNAGTKPGTSDHGTNSPETTDSTPATSTAITTPANRIYRRCDLQIIYYNTFPEPVKEEIDTALADGKYAAEEVLL
ncbi:hypothetical protein [Haladaptatus cibarius]|uniref:hypothetical protein n=1 Tax=Haladaptatus cibarius TaxID=453847 RepID=UPI0006796A03|nr:hypothetical protein [Haladaptatus cibarius]